MSSNTNIGNTPVNQGYVQLIHTGETGGIDGTLRTLYDGDGTASDLQIASNKVKISTELYIGSDTLQEYIQDTVGAMLVTNASHTNLSAAYDDAGDGAIDLTASGDVTLSNSVTLSNKTLAAPTLTGTTQGASITLSGDLTVNGTTTTVNQTNLDVSDNIIGLNRGAGSNANDSGLIIERGSTGDNAAIIWDESADKFTLGTTTSTPSATGDLTISTGTLVATIEGNVTGNVTGSASLNLLKSSNLSDLASASTARSNLGVDAAGTDNSTNVTLAGSLDYLTLSGQEITRNAINLTTDVTGTLPVGNGGTGLTSISTLLNSNVTPTSLGLVIGTNVLAQQTIGIANDNLVEIDDADAADNDYAKFTANGLEGRSFAEVRSDLGLGTLAQKSEIDDIDQIAAGVKLVAGESFVDSDANLMTAAAINDRIESFGYGTGNGDMTGVSITASDPLDISQSNTTSGSYSATISLDASEFGSYLADMTDLVVGGTDELAVLDNGTLKRKQIDEIRLTAFDATGFSSGISFDGSTANGVLTFKDSDEATVESNLTYGSSVLEVQQQVKVTDGTRDIRLNSNHSSNAVVGTVGSHDFNLMTANTFRMTIDDAGLVGIGTTSPGKKLDLRGGNFRVGGFNGGSDYGAIFTPADSASHWHIYNDAGGHLAFGRSATIGSSEKMRIDSSGNVGIGTTSPGEKLEVSGNIKTTAHLVLPYGEINDSGTDLNIVGTNAITLQSESGTALTIPNASTNVILEGELFLKDDKDLVLGNGSDLQIRHDNSSGQGWIRNYTDHLVIENNADDHDIIFKTDNGSGGTATYITLDGSATSISLSQNTYLPDDKKLYIGSHSDQYIYYDGTNNQGFFRATTGDIVIRVEENDHDLILQCDDGSGGVATYLTLDGSATTIRAYQHFNISGVGKALRFDTTGSTESNIIQTINDYETVIATNRGSAGFGVIGNADIRFGFGTNYNAAETDLYINSSGNVGIGETSPISKLHVQDATNISMAATGAGQMSVEGSGYTFGVALNGSGAFLYHNSSSRFLSLGTNETEQCRLTTGGAWHVVNDVVAFSTTPSDKKLKTNVKNIKYGLDTVMKLKPKQYDWKKDNRKDIGFIAQEVEEVIPEIVKDNEWFDDKIKTMDYEKLTAVLIKAVQEQQEQINELKEKLNG